MIQRPFIAICLLISLMIAGDAVTGYSQKIRFSDKNNKWISAGYNYSAHSGYERRRTFGADTVMHGQTYQTINDITILEPASAPAFVSHSVQMYIREDTLNDIVYYRSPIVDTIERVLYNFRLQPGDTITYVPQGILAWIGQETDSVIWVDSVLLNGVYHKKVTMWPTATGNSNNCFTYVEGIGSLNGSYPPFHADCAGSMTELLGCFAQNGTPPVITTNFTGCNHNPYTFTNSAYCGILSVPAVADAGYRYAIFPNPAYDFVTISNESLREASVSITNFLGQELMRSQIAKDEKQVEIDVSNLSGGIYFYSISNNATTQTGKLIIVH